VLVLQLVLGARRRSRSVLGACSPNEHELDIRHEKGHQHELHIEHEDEHQNENGISIGVKMSA